MHAHALLAATLLLAVPPSVPLAFPDAANQHNAQPTPLSITVAGGVSLGAYEAGVLYYLVSSARLNPALWDPRVFTGASAGSINALVAAMESCRPFEPSPEHSLFARVWMPVGFESLFKPGQVQGTALFTRDAFAPAVDAMEQAWREGLPPECDVLLGMTVTRVHARQVPLQGQGMSLPRVTERFVLRLRGTGANQPPLLTNQAGAPGALPSPRLPLDGPDAHPFQALRDVLYASSAFPVAFAPQAVPHCLAGSDGFGGGRCTPAMARPEPFVDGGFLDNQPVGLAAELARSGLWWTPAGPLAVRDAAPPQQDVLQRMLLLHVSPDARAYTTAAQAVRDRVVGDRVTSLAAGMAGELVDGARALSFERLLDADPDVRERLLLAQGQLPKASEPLFGFMGFLERDFRIFDFWLGLYDAHHLLTGGLLPRLPVDAAGPVLPEQAGNQDAAGALAWRPYRCLQAVLDGKGNPAVECAGDGLRNFRILLQVSLERLHDGCRQAAVGRGVAPEMSQPRCKDAMQGIPPARVPGVRNLAGWESTKGESELEHVTRRLGQYGFDWVDLAVPPASSKLGLARVRSLLSQVGASLALAQGKDALPMHVAVEAALNGLAYRPPRHLLHASLGPHPEMGWSTTGPDTWLAPLRLSFALGVDGVDSLLSSKQKYVALSPMAGVELEPIFLSTAWLQPRVGARGGVVLSSGDWFGVGTCTYAREHEVPCSRGVLQAFASLSVLQVLRLQLAAHWWPAWRREQDHLWAISPSIGLQIPLAW